MSDITRFAVVNTIKFVLLGAIVIGLVAIVFSGVENAARIAHVLSLSALAIGFAPNP